MIENIKITTVHYYLRKSSRVMIVGVPSKCAKT